MLPADAQLNAFEVLRAFHRDEPMLFLGAAFNTVAIIAIGICVVRRRLDPLLISLAIFAHLYGARLWLNSNILSLTVPPSEFFDRLRAAVDFSVPIPALIFFQTAGFLGSRAKPVTAMLVGLFAGLTIGAFAYGPLSAFRIINNTTVVVALLVMVVLSFRQKSAGRDNAVLRGGLLCFVGLAICDNLISSLKIEPYGFAVFLASMGYIAARRALEREQNLNQIHKELEVARNIQLSILPGQFPSSTAFDIAARYLPMSSVAGDFYDFLGTGPDCAGLLIADVSGHGVPAALIASMVKMAASSQRAHSEHPAKLLAGMNAALCGNTQGQFVTAAYVHLNAITRELRYAAAGHPSMLLLRGGEVIEIEENGLLLAATESSDYSEKSMQLEPGDRLMLYTDGLLEARNRSGELFGEAALREALRQTQGRSPGEAAGAVIREVQDWASAQDDDLTVLVCDFAGARA